MCSACRFARQSSTRTCTCRRSASTSVPWWRRSKGVSCRRRSSSTEDGYASPQPPAPSPPPLSASGRGAGGHGSFQVRGTVARFFSPSARWPAGSVCAGAARWRPGGGSGGRLWAAVAVALLLTCCCSGGEGALRRRLVPRRVRHRSLDADVRRAGTRAAAAPPALRRSGKVTVEVMPPPDARITPPIPSSRAPPTTTTAIRGEFRWGRPRPDFPPSSHPPLLLRPPHHASAIAPPPPPPCIYDPTPLRKRPPTTSPATHCLHQLGWHGFVPYRVRLLHDDR